MYNHIIISLHSMKKQEIDKNCIFILFNQIKHKITSHEVQNVKNSMTHATCHMTQPLRM